MFNLKDYEKKNNTVMPYEKLLEKNREDFDLEPIPAKNYNKSLEKKDPDGEQIYEKLLDSAREDKDLTSITEKQLDKAPDSNGDKREDRNPEPLMDYANKSEQEQEKEFEKTKPTLPDKEIFSDKFLGEDDPSYNVPVISTGQNSQLLSNYKTRKDFRKKNKSVPGKAQDKSASLVNEDAKLYHVFRVAANEKRELTQEENTFVQEINAKKARILLID